jgi:type I restriction enzyme specificity protein hsdS
MNILEEIQNCPVEWKELGEVCDTVTDFTAAGSFASNAKNVKYIQEASFAQLVRTTDLKSGFKGNNFVYVDEHAFNYLYRVNLDQESLVMPNVGNCGEIYYIEPENLPYENNVLGPNALLVRSSKENNRYLFHLFQSGQFQNELAKITSNTGQTKYNKTNLKKIRIPIPPQEIQEKIVQILDKFTDYVTELTSELTSRKKQYSFYRDKLLSFEDEVYQVEWKTLNEFLKKGKGTKITASQMKLLHKDGAPIRIFAGGKTYADVNYGDIPDKDIHTEEAIVVKSRGIIDFEYCTEPFSFKNEFWSYSSDNENINLRYIYHYLVHNKEHFQNIANNMQMPQISSNDTEKFKIPVPSLKIQSRIVQVLDNFDTVCHDLNIGLPKEIELRQKQYEYFREKLLTFVAEGEYTESRVEEWGNSAIIKLLQWVFGPIRVELGAIGDIIRGNGLQKKDFQDAGVPCIHYGQIYTYYGIETDITKSFINLELSKKLQKAKTGDLIVATTSENVEDVGKSLVWLGKDEVCIGGHSCIIRTEQNSKYLAYFFRTSYFQNQKKKRVLGTKVIELYPKNLAKIQVILPPLSTQSQIVSILDHFNTLTTSISEGLPKEIELRQKQYEYWREQLLNFTR